MKEKNSATTSIIYIVLFFCLFLILVPFAYMILTSLKSQAEALAQPPIIFPAKPQFSNYPLALESAPFLRYFVKFAWMDFPFRDGIFFLILGSMMIPQEMLIITNFLTVAELGWMNTYQALILPYAVNAFNIFLLRQTMKQIPNDLFTASRIDGLSHFRFLRKVIIPIAKPTILTTMLLSLIWIWNTYAWPNLITTRDELRMVSNGLANAFTTNTGSIQYELQMAAATMVTLPLIIIFVILRKNVFSGMQTGGIKG